MNPPADGVPLLQVDALDKRFGTTRVLEGVSFELAPGECVALLGPSGCGKTTTLRCIAGLERPDGGRIRLLGRLLNDGARAVPPQERELGMVFQSYSVWPHLTVFENVAFGLKLRRVRRHEVADRVARSLRMMAIDHLAERRSWQLSGGQLQRVALARTLVTEPKLVLFDEPLSNLDAKLRLHMRVEIRALLERLGMSAVYVTHDQSEASVVADRTAVMNGGRIEQIGAWDALYYRPASRFVAGFIGGGNVLEATVAALDDRGVTVRLDAAAAPVRVPGTGTGTGAGNAPRIGQRVGVYVPREAIRLCAPGEGACPGTIESVLPGPGLHELTIALGAAGRLSAVRLAADGRPVAGTAIGVAFDPVHLHLLPGEPGTEPNS